MARFGFVGPSYTSQSVNADCQLTQNLYPEHDESGQGKSEWQLLPTPGLTLFCATGNPNPVRGMTNANRRCFVVTGDTLVEVYSDGTFLPLGVVGNDGKPVSFANSATELLIASAGSIYVVNLATSSWTGLITTGLTGPVSFVGYQSGFFIALIANSQKFQISSPLDATAWDPTDISQVTVFPDQVLAMIVDHNEIGLFGNTKTVWYQNTGGTFPYTPNLGSYMEQGIGAAFSLVRADNSVAWLGSDDRGNMMAWRLNGYSPVRISNHAVENAWQNYSRTNDAVSFVCQYGGHTVWRITFPTANATWAYDFATGLWHNLSFLNNGVNEAHLALDHTFVFGLHLVGDRRNGNIYMMDSRLTDDDTFAIQRRRRATHVSVEQQRISHNFLQIDAETGLPFQPQPLAGVATGSKAMALAGASTGRTAVTAGTAIPLGNLGQLDIVLEAIFTDGSRQVVLFTNVNNDADHICFVNTPVLANVDHWNVYYCPTGDDTVPSYTLTYTYAAIAAAGNRINFPFALGAVGPSLNSRLTNTPLGALGNLDVALMAIMSDGTRRVSAIFLNVVNSSSSIPYVIAPALSGVISWRVYYCPAGVDDGPSYAVVVTPSSITAFANQINLPLTLGSSAPSLNTVTNPSTPQVVLRFSDDGGHTWSNEKYSTLGRVGEYLKRVIFRRLGTSRDRVYELTYSDTAPLRIIDAYLDASPGYGITERVSSQLRKGA
jgi:hypothetical protein